MTSKKKKRVVHTVKGVHKPKKIKKSDYKQVRQFKINGGLPDPQMIREELKEYREVLFARIPPPIDMGIRTLHEVAEVYFSRACEIEQNILEAMANGFIDKDSPYHSLRTQEIRSYKEMFKSAAELGSRRQTYAQTIAESERRGLEAV